MTLILRFLILILFLTTIQFHVFGQGQDVSKTLFPDNERAQWLVNLLGQPISKKVWKTFKRKIGDRDDSDDMYDDYVGEIYPKNTPAVRTGHYDKVTTYRLESYTNEEQYASMKIRREPSASAPLFNFMNALTIKELEQLIERNPNLESTKIELTEKGGHLNFLHHTAKLFIEVTFRYSTGNIFIVEINKNEYGPIAEKNLILEKSREADQYAEELKATAQQILRTTEVRFDERLINISSDQVRLYDPKAEDQYQIINIRYEGPLTDSIPHGLGEWGIAKKGEYPSSLSASGLVFTGKGRFENGKPVGEHIIHSSERTMIYTYDAGRLKKAQEKDGNYSIHFKDNGSQNEVSAMPFNYGGKIGMTYYGKVDKNRKPHDDKGIVNLGKNKKVTAHFEYGVLKRGTLTSFPHNEVVLTAQADDKLDMMGKVEIQGKKKNNAYRGFVYMRNGQPDLSKEGQLIFDNLKLSDDLNGKFEVRGKIKMNDFANGYFEGEDLEFSFADYPDTKFKGSLKSNSWNVKPYGWHTVTEYKNGIAQSSLKGKYTPKGEFLEGDNFYQKAKATIYESGHFTDNRNGKSYPYKTVIRENGQLITWMMEDIYYENNAGEVWDYGTGSTYRRKCYYSKSNSKMACPRGWRLPSLDDVDEIKDKNTQDKKWITDNTTLISFLDLDRNGYVWEKYRRKKMHQEEKGVFFWLNNGKYISISHLNQGTYTDLDADERFHTCRCVKDGAVEK